MNIGKMMQQAKKMQENMQKMQAEMARWKCRVNQVEVW